MQYRIISDAKIMNQSINKHQSKHANQIGRKEYTIVMIDHYFVFWFRRTTVCECTRRSEFRGKQQLSASFCYAPQRDVPAARPSDYIDTSIFHDVQAFHNENTPHYFFT